MRCRRRPLLGHDQPVAPFGAPSLLACGPRGGLVGKRRMLRPSLRRLLAIGLRTVWSMAGFCDGYGEADAISGGARGVSATNSGVSAREDTGLVRRTGSHGRRMRRPAQAPFRPCEGRRTELCVQRYLRRGTEIGHPGRGGSRAGTVGPLRDVGTSRQPLGPAPHFRSATCHVTPSARLRRRPSARGGRRGTGLDRHDRAETIQTNMGLERKILGTAWRSTDRTSGRRDDWDGRGRKSDHLGGPFLEIPNPGAARLERRRVAEARRAHGVGCLPHIHGSWPDIGDRAGVWWNPSICARLGYKPLGYDLDYPARWDDKISRFGALPANRSGNGIRHAPASHPAVRRPD